MFETCLVPFDYHVVLAKRYRGPTATVFRRATAAIEIEKVRSGDVEIAYRVKHERDLGRGWHAVVRKEGKFWWPLVDTMCVSSIRTARDFLRELRSGQSRLFLRRPFYLDRGASDRRAVVSDAYDRTLANVQRTAKNLLIVDDRLCAAGGIPIIIASYGKLRIASTGADRAVPEEAGDLRIKAANGHHGGTDLAVCRGRFYLPDSRELAEARTQHPLAFHGIGIETLHGDEVDPLVLRIDAAFTTAWTAMNRSIPRTRPQGFTGLREEFVAASGSTGGDYLTLARHRALCRFVELFGQAERIPVAVSECLAAVRQTIALASSAPSLEALPTGLPPTLSAAEDAAIAGLA